MEVETENNRILGTQKSKFLSKLIRLTPGNMLHEQII